MLTWLKKYIRGLLRMKRFRQELRSFRESEQRTKRRFELRDEDLYPCLTDNTPFTGFDRHYVFHVAWACRVVREINPAVHVDFSSSLYFSTTLSAFVPVKFYDYRPADLNLSGLESLRGDLTNIDFPDNSIESVSCLHTIEHVGLGRYGDPIDYDGDIRAINELKRVVKPGGSLLFVTPVGRARIQYNAHRIYAYDQVIELFSGFELKEFSLVPDRQEDGGLIRNASREMSDAQSYGCGCFWFAKNPSR
jgi:SAM-dependent methyltransferase